MSAHYISQYLRVACNPIQFSLRKNWLKLKEKVNPATNVQHMLYAYSIYTVYTVGRYSTEWQCGERRKRPTDTLPADWLLSTLKRGAVVGGGGGGGNGDGGERAWSIFSPSLFLWGGKNGKEKERGRRNGRQHRIITIFTIYCIYMYTFV